MAIIPQQTYFEWTDLEKLGDLERLKLVINYMPDEKLMQTLEKQRGKGRNDYPVRAVWNSILAGIVYQHPTIESLRRELSRNGQLRLMCGFYNNKDVPGADVYTRFLKNLLNNKNLIDDIFNQLIDQLKTLLQDFGKDLAIDGKAIPSAATSYNKNKKTDG